MKIPLIASDSIYHRHYSVEILLSQFKKCDKDMDATIENNVTVFYKDGNKLGKRKKKLVLNIVKNVARKSIGSGLVQNTLSTKHLVNYTPPRYRVDVIIPWILKISKR